MNERIQQLAEQAGWGKGETHDDCMQCSPFDKEKFAELIVRECAAEADKQTIYCRGIPWGKWIKQHFGVKE
jgi:hypothetical protein